MLGDMKPFKLVGNVYFVGTRKASCHMIDTGEGLILIDVGYEETADVVMESMASLGFDVKDVKYILLSHGHHDHSDGVPKIVEKSGAEVFLGQPDIRYLKGFLPDHYLQDGDIIRLGNTEVLCLESPGHTEGTFSFFFDVTENDRILRVGMFGGAGTNQLRKPYLDQRNLTYHMRGKFLKTLQKLRKEHVDVLLGNHVWHNDTQGNYEKSLICTENPFIDSTRWETFLDRCEAGLEKVIEEETHTFFVNYAHRGASEYVPENTLLAFYTGIYMNANGIETDVQRTKDGILVLFHDDTLLRVTGEEGAIEDYTFEELQNFNVSKNGYNDKIVSLEDFLKKFSFRDLTFAIELKKSGVEKDTADLIRKFHMEQKVVVTSFNIEYIRNIKEYAPELRVGLLTSTVDDQIISDLKQMCADELCPRANLLTPELVHSWHREGYRVRAWGVSNEELMQHVYDCHADGMTVNFPDKLAALIDRATPEHES